MAGEDKKSDATVKGQKMKTHSHYKLTDKRKLSRSNDTSS